MLLQLVITLAALPLFQGLKLDDGTLEYDSPEQAELYPVLEALVDYSDSFIAIIEELFEFDPEGLDNFVENLDEMINEPDLMISCLQCRTYIGGIKALINQGLEFEDVRDLAIDICMDITEDNNWRGDIICDGMIDNYGPHVMYILNSTELTANEICIKHRACDDEEDYQAKPARTYLPKHDRQHKREKRDLRNMIKIAHFTDIHIDEKYFTGAATDCNLPVCCREYWNGTGSAGNWGDYNCNVPPRTVDLLMEHIAELDPDYVMYTGDSPPHSLWEETLEKQIDASRFVPDAIRRNFPGTEAHQCQGNHEPFPANLFHANITETIELNKALREMWQPLSHFTAEEAATMEWATFYSHRLQPGLIVLVYNSNYGYTDNFYGILNENTEDIIAMEAFMEETLNAARENGDRVVLLGHHPSGSRGYFKYYEDLIEEQLLKHGDVATLHLLGHTHSNSFKVVRDPDTQEPRNLMLVTAATSCSPNNPFARVFYLDPDTFETVDYESYYLDLQEAFESANEAEIKLMYRASEEYGVDSITLESFDQLLDRMADEEDPVYDQYRFNSNTRRYQPGPCTGTCRKNAICGMSTVSHVEYVRCTQREEGHLN